MATILKIFQKNAAAHRVNSCYTLAISYCTFCVGKRTILGPDCMHANNSEESSIDYEDWSCLSFLGRPLQQRDRSACSGLSAWKLAARRACQSLVVNATSSTYCIYSRGGGQPGAAKSKGVK